MSDDKKYPVVSKEAVDNIFTSENGWATVYEGPTLRIPDFEVKKDATGADSIREGIDTEILQMMMNKSLVEEEAAIIDYLKRQMEAGVIMPQVYVPLQVSNLFKKEEGK